MSLAMRRNMASRDVDVVAKVLQTFIRSWHAYHHGTGKAEEVALSTSSAFPVHASQDKRKLTR